MGGQLLAQIRNPVLPGLLGGGTNPNYQTGGQAVGSVIGSLAGLMFIGGFIIAFIYLLTGAFFWITSGGDKANLEHARSKIIHAIVGLIILSAAWAITTLLAQFFGLDFENLPIPTIGQSGTRQSAPANSGQPAMPAAPRPGQPPIPF